jgi:hypothetical protein
MNRFVLMIACILVVFSLQAGGKKEKKNKVKSTTVYMTVYKDQAPVKYRESYEEFDKDGNTLQKVEYGKDGSITHKETAKYDGSGNKTEETVFDPATGLDVRKVYRYDAFKKVTEETEYNAGGVLQKKTVTTYTLKGKKASETVTDSGGNPIKKILYTYNEHDMKSTKKTFRGTNTPESLKEWQYEYQ